MSINSKNSVPGTRYSVLLLSLILVAYFIVGVDPPDPSERVNVYLPKSLIGRGDADVNLMIDGRATNTVKVNFK